MSLTFYYAPMSTASITTLVLEELAGARERVKLDLKKGETKTPEFLKRNPNGKVPVIVHDGSVIFESAAITLYLGEVFGTQNGLWPAAGPKRGEAMKWVGLGERHARGCRLSVGAKHLDLGAAGATKRAGRRSRQGGPDELSSYP